MARMSTLEARSDEGAAWSVEMEEMIRNLLKRVHKRKQTEYYVETYKLIDQYIDVSLDLLKEKAPTLYNAKLYCIAIRLKLRGLGRWKIHRILVNEYGADVAWSSVGHWIDGRHHPLGEMNPVRPCRELAMLIAANLGDGSRRKSVKYHDYETTLISSGREFAQLYEEWEAVVFGRKKVHKPWYNKKFRRFEANAKCRPLYELIGLAKENPWSVYKILKTYAADACRAFASAEGTVSVRNRRIDIYNTNRALLEVFEKLLKEELGIDCRIMQKAQVSEFVSPRTGKVYKPKKDKLDFIRISRKENLIKFFELGGFLIKEKQEKLKKVLSRYATNP